MKMYSTNFLKDRAAVESSGEIPVNHPRSKPKYKQKRKHNQPKPREELPVVNIKRTEHEWSNPPKRSSVDAVSPSYRIPPPPSSTPPLIPIHKREHNNNNDTAKQNNLSRTMW
jgi:hypothetical protein